MAPQSKLFVIIFSIIGFFLIPACLLGFFMLLRIENPRFYTNMIKQSRAISMAIEEQIVRSGEEDKKKMSAIRKNLAVAKNDINWAVQEELFWQISSKVDQFVRYLKGPGRNSPQAEFPSLVFEMKAFKGKVQEALQKAKMEQKLHEKIVIDAVTRFISLVPNRFELERKVDLTRIKAAIEKNRKFIQPAIRTQWAIPFLCFLVLLLFMLSTFDFKQALHAYSNLLIISGISFGIVFVLIFIANEWLYGPFLPKLQVLVKHLSKDLPPNTTLKLAQFVIRSVAIHGLISSAIMILGGILFFTNTRKKKKPEYAAQAVRPASAPSAE